jgi:transposase
MTGASDMRLVQEARRKDPELSLNAAVVSGGSRVGVNADTLRGWCKQAAIDVGERSARPPPPG